jgi:hypothetical protein
VAEGQAEAEVVEAEVVEAPGEAVPAPDQASQ